jgi:hypothetical protein
MLCRILASKARTLEVHVHQCAHREAAAFQGCCENGRASDGERDRKMSDRRIFQLPLFLGAFGPTSQKMKASSRTLGLQVASSKKTETKSAFGFKMDGIHSTVSAMSIQSALGLALIILLSLSLQFTLSKAMKNMSEDSTRMFNSPYGMVGPHAKKPVDYTAPFSRNPPQKAKF